MNFRICESCVQGKMSKMSFKKKSSELLEIIHSDVCVPMRVKAHRGLECFNTLDDNSGFEYVYLTTHKSKSVKKFKKLRM